MYEHIKVIEFTEQIGRHCMEKVALFNANQLSTEEAIRILKSGEYNDNVLTISKRQWLSLFGDRRSTT